MKIALKLLMLLVLTVYLVMAFVRMSQTSDDTLCRSFQVIVPDSAQAGFINQAEVERLLRNAHLHPVGWVMDSVRGEAIENELLKNSFVKTATCYKTAGGVVKVVVGQRMPVLRVLSDDGGDYYVDEMGDRLPLHGYRANLVVASGSIDSTFVKDRLVHMGIYLRDNAFWNDQITQIHIDPTHHAVLIPRVGSNLLIRFGEVDSIARKFRHLRAFYEQVVPNVGWEAYREISLEYENQVVCKKK